MLHALSSLPPDDKAFFFSEYCHADNRFYIHYKTLSSIWECFVLPEHIIHWKQASLDWYCPKAVCDFQVGGTFT